MAAAESTLGLSSLWPNFSALWAYIDGAEPFAPEVFSAFIVVFLLLIFIVFGFYVLVWGFFRATVNIRKLRSIVDQLDRTNLPEQRRRANEQAKEIGEVGNIWAEFDESLVVITSENRLTNTLDADYFFNAHSLAPSLTENRLVAAVPGFLTAIGVIGTFAGLQMGLESVNFDGSSIEQREDIQHVIESAAVAFLTSVWGVGTSVIFNGFEKLLEQLVKKKITKLQSTIDLLFPRQSPEQSLVSIATSSQSTEEALSGLAERIGEQLQAAVSGMGNQVTEGIREIMQPAVDRLIDASSGLADRQASGATDALAELVQGFTEKVSEAGSKQRQLMDDATKGLGDVIAELRGNMDGFLNKLEKNTEAATAHEGQLRRSLFDGLEKAGKDMDERLRSQVEASENTISQNKAVSESLSSLAEQLQQVMGDLDTYSERMGGASEKLRETGDRMERASNQLSGEITKAAQAVQDLSLGNENVAQSTKTLVDELSHLEDKLGGAGQSIEHAAELASNSFSELKSSQSEYLQHLGDVLEQNKSAIQQSVDELTEKTSEYVTNYTALIEQSTNKRLGDWNDQTKAFTQEMINVTTAISSALAEIEDMKRG